MSPTNPTPQVRVHQDWLGMVQPTGLFLAPRVLADAGASPTDPILDVQRTLAEHVAEGRLRDPWALFTDVLCWPAEYLHHELSSELTLTLEGGVRVVPDFALRDLDEQRYVLLGKIVDAGIDLDQATDDDVWTASAHQRFERLLRGRDCPVGVITNSKAVRIVYAPKGEATAYATWLVGDLVTVAGRPLLAALDMCLNVQRLLTLPAEKRLPALLLHSREFQNTVSTALQGQVLDALQDLLDGIQRADAVTGGRLLARWRGADDDRQVIYRGLVTALMRMVFVLFAEERRLLPLDAVLYRESYSLTDLHKRLQDDHAQVGANLDARYGAWARVIALFRLLHDGLDAREIPGGFYIPPRRGDFFDPDRFPFLEGRADVVAATSEDEPLEIPKVPDGVVYRALDKLLVLGGERLKYSDLAVEQIGSVYEGIMGYDLDIAEGRALRLRLSSRETGTLDVVIDLQKFNDQPRDAFLKHLKDDLGLKPSDATEKALKLARSEDDVRTAIAQQHRTFHNVTSIAHGWMYLQPGQERRRSGSHYTPRSLTEPIVARTLAPVLTRLGEHPTPEAILGLKVCDPAMGSGAFLVEACRQLAAKLEEAWLFHKAMPEIPPDEDPHLHARRRVAQRCLYGVDRNPLAVDLARLSLWLETFARDHAFTFVDHCLRHGDSLVGLSLDQIASVSLDTRVGTQLDIVREAVNRTLKEVRRLRRDIHTAGDGDPPDNAGQRELWREAQDALLEARTVGNLVVAGFFSQKTDKDRAKWIDGHRAAITQWLHGDDSGEALRAEVKRLLDERGLVPFHWELEFPEVFGPHPFAALSLKGEGGGERRMGEREESGRKGGGITRAREVDPIKLERARAFRKEPTPAEARAWEILRDRSFLGLKFRRQHVIDGFVADFLCVALGLVLEIDGSVHDDPQWAEYDAIRTTVFESHGLRVVRVTNKHVSPEVLNALLLPIVEGTDLTPQPPLPKGRGGAGLVTSDDHSDSPAPVRGGGVGGEVRGVDAFMGNPPYAGKNNLLQGNAEGYLDWLKALHEESHGNADLVAHFFRRAFNYLRDGGALGLIATNTLYQGDTRSTGLRWICNHGGAIYDAHRRYKWPGVAAVVVVVVHIIRGEWRGVRRLDERTVNDITAFLFHRGGGDDPVVLATNESMSFQGCNVLGKGFTFDDREKKRETVNSLADMRALIEKDPRNGERIFPYLGGEELNEDPEQKPHRYVINFGEMTEEEARQWPDLMATVRAKVRPERMKLGNSSSDKPRKERWWLFGRYTPGLFRAIKGKTRVLAISRHTQFTSFCFQQSGLVFSEALVLFVSDRDAFFTVMQSRVHETWARFFASSLEDRLRYTPSDCFETFPFPPGWETDAALEDIGRRYDEHRAAMMKRTVGTKKPEGLTATYNRFHDPN